MGWLCGKAYGGRTRSFTLTLPGHARLSDGRERGNTFRTVETRIGAGVLRRSPEDGGARQRLLKVRWEQNC